MSHQNMLTTWKKEATASLLSLLVLMAATSLWAADEAQFTNQSRQGKWAFSASGTIVPPRNTAAHARSGAGHYELRWKWRMFHN